MPKGNPNGRPPSLDPRTIRLTIQLSAGEDAQLREAAEIMGCTRTRIVTRGIQLVHAEALGMKARKEGK